MSLSDSSTLSSPPTTDSEELEAQFSGNDGMLKFVSRAAHAPAGPNDSHATQRKRAPSPPHEYVLADNADIAFIVMFRSRFHEAFPKSLGHYGPQDIENGVVDSVPSEQVENLLCALLGLVLNRKKYVERGHYHRALEEAVLTHTPYWPREWNGTNPLHGGKTFLNMSPAARLTLLKTLILWALASSEAVQAVIKDSYKQARHDDDLNQPLSVQPWGVDGDKRRYWLIEGRDDTSFRLYRESNIKLKNNTWWSVAGSIDELKTVGQQLSDEGSQAARRLSERINLAIPRFEATEETQLQKRRRREYRMARKAQFTRADPGFSLYEGRTRGKKIKYTYSSDEGEGSDVPSGRRSRPSGISTPGERADEPTFTASGRQVRSRFGGAYGESMFSGRAAERLDASMDGADDGTGDGPDVSSGLPNRSRPTRVRPEADGWSGGGDHIAGYNSVDEMDDEEDAASSGADDYNGDDDVDADLEDDNEEEEDVSDDEDDLGGANGVSPNRSLVVQLRYGRHQSSKAAPDHDRPASDAAALKANGAAESPTNALSSLVMSKPTAEPALALPSINGTSNASPLQLRPNGTSPSHLTPNAMDLDSEKSSFNPTATHTVTPPVPTSSGT
ncbi:MAG: hypothetical protein M1838_001508 [Thelocarpon superellum]|nr:MAG: hypothetical protein M1838_001508 [Thelocarpon superellum]